MIATKDSSEPARGTQATRLSADPPRVDERLVGRPYRYGYAVGYAPGTTGISGPDAILKHDVATRRTQTVSFGPGREPGEFVFVPTPLPPGDYSLTLRATQSDGTVLTSKNSVAVALRSGKPDVALPLPAKSAAVLPNGKTDASRSADIAIVAVESKESGKLSVSGRSEPGATVKLYLNGSYIASTTASAEGHVAFAIGGGIMPGDYRVRLDVVDGTAALRARAEESFSAPALSASASVTAAAPSAPDAPGSASAVVPRIGTAVVNRGDNLWHISRSTYGQGVRYSKIYDANRDQIRNPAVIFPGQIFVLPSRP